MIVNQWAGSGKDTTADYLVEKYGFTKIALADYIYVIARELFGMTIKDRELLIAIGQKMREIVPTVFIDYTLRKAQQYDRIIITDVRQDNEYRIILNKGFLPIKPVAEKENCITRIILRDGTCDVSLLNIQSEIGASKYPSIELNNNGDKKDLYMQLDFVMKQNWDEYILRIQHQVEKDIFFNQYA
jgi:hypothetical protein